MSDAATIPFQQPTERAADLEPRPLTATEQMIFAAALIAVDAIPPAHLARAVAHLEARGFVRRLSLTRNGAKWLGRLFTQTRLAGLDPLVTE